MPSIKCLACGHRNLHATAHSKCSNCGTPLASELFESQVVVSEEPSTGTLPFVPGVRTSQPSAGFLPPPTGSVRERTVQSPSSFSQNTQQALLGQNTSSRANRAKERAREHNQALMTHQETLPATHSPRGAQELRTQVEPYRERDVSPTIYQNPFGNSTNIFPSPYSADEHSSPMIIQNPTPPAAPPQPLWSLEGLPRSYQRTPDLAGTLIHVQGQMEEYHTYDIISSIGKLLAAMIWPSSAVNDAQHREKDQIFVTTLRIRTEDGTQQDARLQGHLTSANLTLGDTILLWGRKRNGSLLVSQGYNFTSKSRITTRAMKSPFVFIVTIVIMLVLLYLFLTWKHIAFIHL